jgi:hypothetical protein
LIYSELAAERSGVAQLAIFISPASVLCAVLLQIPGRS